MSKKIDWNIIDAKYNEIMSSIDKKKLIMKENYKAEGLSYSAEGTAIFDNGTHAEIYTPDGKTVTFYKPTTNFTRV